MREMSIDGNLERIGVTGILDSLADGAYITDPDRRILFWNRAAERITGWQPADVVGKSCRDNILAHVDKDGRELCGQDYCPLHRSIVTGHPSEASLLVFAKHKSGHRIPMEVTVAPLRTADGTIVGGIEVFRDLAELTGDLWRAKAIQDHAMESDLAPDPRLDVEIRSVPQEIVGGDFHHAGWLDDGRLAVLVADVMGHGVSAALYGMQLRLLWDEMFSDLVSPAVFMAKLNNRLVGLVSKDGYFATAALVVLDPASGKLECVRAGHPPPMLVSPDGAVRRIGAQQPALGLFDGIDYSLSEGGFAVGDHLLLYTDGAVEIDNAAGAELGEDGLAALAGRLAESDGGLRLDRLEEALFSYGDRLRFADDLTLLRIGRVG